MKKVIYLDGAVVLVCFPLLWPLLRRLGWTGGRWTRTVSRTMVGGGWWSSWLVVLGRVCRGRGPWRATVVGTTVLCRANHGRLEVFHVGISIFETSPKSMRRSSDSFQIEGTMSIST